MKYHRPPSSGNPDVDEVIAANYAACKHPETVMKSVAVGAGWPRIGCHMEQQEVCRDCGKPQPGRSLLREMKRAAEAQGKEWPPKWNP